MVATKKCAWGTCKNDTRYPHLYTSNPNGDPPTFFHFPGAKREPERRKKWIIACHRGDKFTCTKDSYICSLHFVGSNGPTKENPDPVSAVASGEKAKKLARKRRSPAKRVIRTPPKKRRAFEREIAQSLLNLADGLTSDNTITDDEMAIAQGLLDLSKMPPESPHQGQERDVEMEMDELEAEDNVLGVNMNLPTQNRSTQTTIKLEDISKYTDDELTDSKKLQRKLFMLLMQNPKDVVHYTGLTSKSIDLIYQHVKAKAKEMKLWQGKKTSTRIMKTMKQKYIKQKHQKSALSIKEQLVLTLVKLKRNPTLQMLGNLFGISMSSCSRIFTSWVLFLAKELEFLLHFATLTEMEGLKRPTVFKPIPDLRAIVDCTEFFIEKPSRPSSQRLTHSQYKSANTFKLLVSLSPLCHFSFVSPLFVGSISDKAIITDSGFVTCLEEGDVVMADKGYNIQDILALHNVYLLARRIAKVRVHVERVIRKLKLFRVLRSPIPLCIKPYVSSIVSVCAAIVNLQSSIIDD